MSQQNAAGPVRVRLIETLEDAPPFAALEVDGVDADGTVRVRKPRAGVGAVLLNGPVPIRREGEGQAWHTNVGSALTDQEAGKIESGTSCGPIAGRWGLSTSGKGFQALEKPAEGTGAAAVVRWTSPGDSMWVELQTLGEYGDYGWKELVLNATTGKWEYGSKTGSCKAWVKVWHPSTSDGSRGIVEVIGATGGQWHLFTANNNSGVLLQWDVDGEGVRAALQAVLGSGATAEVIEFERSKFYIQITPTGFNTLFGRGNWSASWNGYAGTTPLQPTVGVNSAREVSERIRSPRQEKMPQIVRAWDDGGVRFERHPTEQRELGFWARITRAVWRVYDMTAPAGERPQVSRWLYSFAAVDFGDRQWVSVNHGHWQGWGRWGDSRTYRAAIEGDAYETYGPSGDAGAGITIVSDDMAGTAQIRMENATSGIGHFNVTQFKPNFGSWLPGSAGRVTNTVAVSWNATATDVQTALNAVNQIPESPFVVTGGTLTTDGDTSYREYSVSGGGAAWGTHAYYKPALFRVGSGYINSLEPQPSNPALAAPRARRDGGGFLSAQFTHESSVDGWAKQEQPFQLPRIVWMELFRARPWIMAAKKLTTGDGVSTHTSYRILSLGVARGKWALTKPWGLNDFSKAYVTNGWIPWNADASAVQAKIPNSTVTGTPGDWTVTFTHHNDVNLSIDDTRIYGNTEYIFELQDDKKGSLNGIGDLVSIQENWDDESFSEAVIPGKQARYLTDVQVTYNPGDPGVTPPSITVRKQRGRLHPKTFSIQGPFLVNDG